jgi:hypothetical protein
MTQPKDRERVIAEITLSHLLRLANEHHCFVSRKQSAKVFQSTGTRVRSVEANDAGGREFYCTQFIRAEH